MRPYQQTHYIPPSKVSRLGVHFTATTIECSTDQETFDKLDAEFGFEVDVCATPANAKCDRYYTRDDDGLAQEWCGACWCNPPYGKEIGRWIRKAYESSLQGATVVCLIPARTDTSWWHDYIMKGEVRLVRGRLRFNGSANGAPFPSAIVVFRPPMGDTDSGRVR